MGKKIFILDTNVLIHDPSALFRFQEHDIFIPMIVLEELDNSKKGFTEVARNARQASRFLDELIQHTDIHAINEGIPLPQVQFAARIDENCSGRLFFQIKRHSSVLPDTLPGGIADNAILATAMALAQDTPDKQVILVSKDINMRIKASVLGIKAEDFHSDQVLDDVNLLYSGMEELPADFWETHGNKMESWQDHKGRSFYKVSGPLVKGWHSNQFLYLADDTQFECIVRAIEGQQATLEVAKDYRSPQHNVWGIQARNREQNFALNVLLDPEIDFVSLLGQAGTGKTLLALAAGLAQTLDDKVYREIIMTRETIPLGEDIGFLPGTEEEKIAPWMGALLDNLELLNTPAESGEWEKGATHSLITSKVKVRALNFMRGRTFLNRYIILDEAQNLTPKQMKTLITRAGPSTKIICLGNLAQIDTPYLTGTTSGLTYVVDHFKAYPNGAHLTLRRGERSRLADYAADTL